MDARTMVDHAPKKVAATTERKSDRELVFARTVNGPGRLVFEAWTKPELLKRWWAPKSLGLTILSWDADVRVGGAYRIVMRHPSLEQPMAFFGKYLEVTPPARLVWTNEESADRAVSTVTFEEQGGKTRVVLLELYPSKEALDAAIASGSSAMGEPSSSGMGEQFDQLDELLVSLGGKSRDRTKS